MYKGKIRVTILITFLLISVVPLLVSISLYFYVTGSSLRTAAVSHLEHLSEWEARLIREWFNKHMSNIRMLAGADEVQARDLAKTYQLLKRIQGYYPEYGSIGLADINGKVVVHTSGTIVDISDREYFKAAVKGKEFISEMIISRTYNRPCIVFSAPVTINGKITGILYGSVAVDTLSNIISGFAIGETGENYLVDRKGNLITIPASMKRSRVNSQKILPAPQDSIVSDGFTGHDGVVLYNDYRGKDVIGTRRWLSDLQILLITKQDEAEAIQQAGGKGLKVTLMTGILFIIALLPVVWIISRRISNPLSAIVRAVNEIAAGNLGHRVEFLKSNEEIQLLGSQINDLALNMQLSRELINDQLSELEAQKEEIMSQNEDILKAYEKLADVNRELTQMAATDQLTETYNRRYFMERLRSEVLISLRSKRPLSVAIMDIDHFKSINDTHGHKAGDQVLQKVVKVILANIRRSDLLARFGGEEFIVLAPETDLKGALSLAEKIRQALDQYVFETDGGSLKVTVSIGVAELKYFSDSVEKVEDELLLTADRYLYEAKRKGRNGVEGPPV